MNKLFIIIFIALFTVSCGKEDDNLILDVPVNFSSSISPQLANLQSQGGVVVISNQGVGVAGLILYHNSAGRIVAYDRCSSVNPIQKNPVQLLAGSIVEDKISGAYFNLEDGAAYKAPATRPLKSYIVTINGNYLTVTN
jgi:nitrite reductase/ring-hydroxylating ferredoxin subunit